MKMPETGGSRFGASVKLTALVVTVAMLGMCYRSPRLQALAATLGNMQRSRAQALAPRPQPLPPSRDQALSEAMGKLGRAVEQVLAQEGPRAEADAQLATLSQQLDQLERDNVAEFEQVERHLVDHQLPAVLLERHREAVRTFAAEVARLRASLAALQAARTPAERTRLAGEARELLASRLGEKSFRPVDPKRLPFRSTDRKPMAPALSAEDLQRRLASLETGRTGGTRGTRSLGGDVGTTASALQAESVSPDLAATEDVQLTQEVRDLAFSLGNNPVRIFNWVHDNVRFVPTYGSVQGSELTRVNKQGNAFDTASLLIALLRAANIPAHYVYGTVQVPASQVRAWVGDVPSMQVAQQLMASGGIPSVAVVQGGALTHIRLEHVWVEALVDFEPSRGAVNKQGDTWVQLDASFKQHEREQPLDLSSEVSVGLTDVLDDVKAVAQADAEGGVTQLYPGYVGEKGLEAAREALQQLQAKYPALSEEQVTGTVRVVPRDSQVLDATLPYEVVVRGATASALAPGLRHAVSLRMYPSLFDRAMGSPDLEVSVSLATLGNRRLSVNYAPASDADAQLLQSYKDSGATSVPVYLVQMVPQVQLDGVTLASGTATTMGTLQSWELTLSGPNDPGGAPDVYDIAAGSVSVFGIDGNGLTREAVEARTRTFDELSVAENMHQVGLRYFCEVDMFDEVTASMRKVSKLRLPSAGLFSAPLQVGYLFGMPRTGTFTGRMMDVKRVLVAVAADSAQARFDFMSQAGMQGSFLEGSVLDQVFGRMPGTASSTAQVLVDAASAQIPIYRLDASNVDTLLPKIGLSSASRSEIAAAVQSGKVVTVPQYAPRGVMGYLIQDRESGAGAYLIDGGLSGGVGEDCNKQPQPDPVKVPVFNLLALLFLVLLILAIIALMMSPGGQVAVPALASVVVAIVFAMVLAPSNAYAAEPRVCCIPKPVPHLGGDVVHNACADEVPPNVFPGSDVHVDGKNFDALDPSGTLWEAKTYNSANCTSTWCKEVWLPQQLAADRAELAREQQIATKCERPFGLLAGDPAYAAAMAGVVDTVVVDPRCLQPAK